MNYLIKWILYVFAVAAFTVFAAAEDVAIKWDKYGRILMPVVAEDGTQTHFIFDSANGRTAIRKAGIDQFNAKMYEGSIRHLASSGFFQLPVASIKSLTVSGIKLQDHVVAVYSDHFESDYSDDFRVQGLVGFDIFRGHLIKLNITQKSVSIFPNAGHLDNEKWGLVTGWPNANGSIMTTFEYEGIKITVLMATGYSKSAINNHAYRYITEKDPSKRSSRREPLVRGMENRTKTRRTLVLEDLTIKGWELGDLEVVLTPMETDKITGYRNTPLLVLGADVLVSRDMVFDYRDFQIWYRYAQKQNSVR